MLRIRSRKKIVVFFFACSLGASSTPTSPSCSLLLTTHLIMFANFVRNTVRSQAVRQSTTRTFSTGARASAAGASSQSVRPLLLASTLALTSAAGVYAYNQVSESNHRRVRRLLCVLCVFLWSLLGWFSFAHVPLCVCPCVYARVCVVCAVRASPLLYRRTRLARRCRFSPSSPA
jgi:hypothetical protein